MLYWLKTAIHVAPIVAIFISTFYRKQINPCPNSSASHVENDNQLSTYVSRKDGGHSKGIQALMDVRQACKEDWVKAGCSTFDSITHMFIYLAMAMNGISGNCTCIRLLVANVVTSYVRKLYVYKTPCGKCGHIIMT